MNVELAQGSRILPAQRIDALSHTLWLTLGVVLLGNSIARGIRAPGRWVYTEMLLNYDFGFSKRGLLGSVISTLHISALYHYNFCFWYCITLFVINTALLISLMRKLCVTGDNEARWVVLIFSSSLAAVMFAHTIGYGDQTGLLITLLALRVERFNLRAALVSILFPLSMLVHESNVVLFFPVVVLRFLLDLGSRPSKGRLVALGATILSVVATFFFLGSTHVSATLAHEMYNELQAKANYPLREDQFLWITATFSDTIRSVIQDWSEPWYPWWFFDNWIVTFPTTAYLIFRSWRSLSENYHAPLIRCAAIAASLAPLSMHLIGLDLNRWTTLATTTSFLTLTAIALTSRTVPTTPGPRKGVPVIPALLIAMNLGSTVPLFDGYAVQNFPYSEHIHDLIEMIDGDAPFPPEPEQCVESGCLAIVNGLYSRSAVSAKDAHPQ